MGGRLRRAAASMQVSDVGGRGGLPAPALVYIFYSLRWGSDQEGGSGLLRWKRSDEWREGDKTRNRLG